MNWTLIKNAVLVLIIISIITLIVAVVYCFIKRDSFENEKLILKAPQCTHAGLGDRIGEYIIFSTLGKIYNCNVLVYWNIKNHNSASRGNEYPNNILDYIQFPDNLKFVTQKEWRMNKVNVICPNRFKWNNYYYGDEFVPEIVHKKLNLSKYINLDNYIKLYKQTASEISYKKELPTLPNNFTAVHVRRGDKSKEFFNNKNPIDFHDKRLNNVFNKLNVNNYILCSEDGNPIKSKLPVSVKLSNDKMIKTLQEFFILSKARIIIQSIPGDNKYGGWTSFSYVASRIGDSVLYNCSPVGTRLYYMEGVAGRRLYNIIKYSDLM